MAGVALHLAISGVVQGVGYRRWLAREAQRLGVSGWVRNRSNGTVEAVVAGETRAVEMFLAACRSGPHGAVVSTVETAPAEAPPEAGFSVLPTA